MSKDDAPQFGPYDLAGAQLEAAFDYAMGLETLRHELGISLLQRDSLQTALEQANTELALGCELRKNIIL